MDTKTLTQSTEKDRLANKQVIQIQEDDLVNIWFGTGLFGISKFDGKSFSLESKKVNITKGSETDWKSKDTD